MSHVVASYVCRKNMFYNQTSLKGFSAFSTISLAFSITSVVPAKSMWKINFLTPGKRGTYSKRTFLLCLLFYQDRRSFFVSGWFISTEYRPSPISSGGQEITLLLKFSCPEQKTFEKMRNFLDSLCDNDYKEGNDEESSDEEEAAVAIETDQSKPVSRMAADQPKVS